MEKKQEKIYRKRNQNMSLEPLTISKGLVSSFYCEDRPKNLSPTPSRDYQITNANKRIVKRIIHPKRDKIIQNSLYFVRRREGNKGVKSMHQAPIARSKENSKMFTIHKSKTKKRQRQNEHQQQYKLRLENQRMGQRIVNAKSYFSVNQSHISQNKLNDGVKVFFQKGQGELSKQIKNQSFNYGSGPTILLLSNIKIDKNPSLRDDDLICIEMLVKSKGNQKFCTQGIRYDDLQKTQIKFGVKIKQIGQFVPVKFSKVQGVDLHEIGIVDIDFIGYRRNSENGFEGDLRKEQNKSGKARYILSREIVSRMRKSKYGSIQGEISLEYKMYSKRYK